MRPPGRRGTGHAPAGPSSKVGRIDDTARMWMIVRVAAVLVILVLGVLIAGWGEGLLGVVDSVPGLGNVPGSQLAGDDRPATVAGIAGLVVGVLAAVLRPVARGVGQVVTLLHELGHTVVAAALGARPAGIVLRHDASGHATARWVGRPTWTRRFSLALVAFAGLPAAAVVTAAGAQLLRLLGPDAVLWSFAVAGGLVALLARSVWSLLVAAGLAGVALAALSEVAAPWAAAVVVALLTSVAVKTTVDNLRRLRWPIQEGDDARAVGRRLRLPARFVQWLQVVVAAVLSGWAVWLLLPTFPG